MPKTNIFLGIIPAGTMIIGTIIGKKLQLKPNFRAALLAITAGLVSASIITDVSPTFCSIEGDSNLQKQALIGIAIGSLVMLFLQSLDSSNKTICKDNDKCKKQFKFPIVLTAALAADVFIDGLVIGQSISLNKPAIGFITAMGLEGFITTSALSNIIKDRGGSTRDILISSGSMILSSIFGLFLGKVFGSQLKDVDGKINPKKVKIYGGALIVLLWTVCIELLPEALEESDKLWVYALWLLSTAGGISLDWIADYFNEKKINFNN